MPKKPLHRKIVVTGGGTGGHIMPALAVAEALQKAEWQVTFIGSQTGPEEDAAKQAGLRFIGIQAGKLRRYFDFRNLTDIFRVIIGFFQARAILAKLKPAAVFSKGGYVSVPVVYAAAFLEIPVVIHESDAVMGLANRLVADRADLICTGFPIDFFDQYRHSPQHNHYPDQRTQLRFTGTPVRSIFLVKQSNHAELLQQFGFNGRRPVVLIMGGSQGAQPINRLIFDSLKNHLEHYQIIHLTGLFDISMARKQRMGLTATLQRRYQPFSYLTDELPAAMSLADVVITRASASVLAELALLGKPLIAIPLPNAAGDHQRTNAAVLSQKDAAIVLEQNELTPEKLVIQVTQLLKDKERRRQLHQAIQTFASPDAARIIAELVGNIAAPPAFD